MTVIAAHCATKSGAFDHDYFDDWVAMLREFPNLYGDISALVSLNRCGHLRDCLRPEIAPRILHGSDFPVPVLGHRLWLQRWIDTRDLPPLPGDRKPARTRLAIQACTGLRRRGADEGKCPPAESISESALWRSQAQISRCQVSQPRVTSRRSLQRTRHYARN